MALKLITAKIENFKSLENVDLSFRDLTIIVGSNSSGKSNCLEALKFTRNLLVSDALTLEIMQKYLRLETKNICSTIVVEDDGKRAEYTVSMTSNRNNAKIVSEQLIVNGIKVIQIINGQGKVCDEDGKNPQTYKSEPKSIESLALRSAGNFGNKPFTKKLASYIREWKFYDINPDEIRQFAVLIENIEFKIIEDNDIPSLNSEAREVQLVLNYWARTQENKITEINEELKNCLNIRLIPVGKKKPIVKILESDAKQMSLSSMSDGTLRLIAYLTLLYQTDSDIPRLISIEEPERNFHPGILQEVASIIKRLSKRTQVVFTTHSSQLLDCFSPEEISEDISLILLSKNGEHGTKACLLDKLAESHDDISDWMTDFGIGSAIYHSHLIEGILAG